MAQVSGQSRQQCIDILILAVPEEKSGAGKAMTQVVQPWTRAALAAAQPTVFEHLAKSVIDVGVIEPVAGWDDEERTVREGWRDTQSCVPVSPQGISR